MAIDHDTFDSTTGSIERWDDEKEQLPKPWTGKGLLFDFGCFEAKDGKDYATFGFKIQAGEEVLKCQRFYEVTDKTYWKLKNDITAILGFCPEAAQIQRVVDGVGRTGPIAAKLVGKEVDLFFGEIDGWDDLWITKKSVTPKDDDLDLADDF